jgi:hypothetical protein
LTVGSGFGSGVIASLSGWYRLGECKRRSSFRRGLGYRSPVELFVAIAAPPKHLATADNHTHLVFLGHPYHTADSLLDTATESTKSRNAALPIQKQHE